MNGNQDTKYIPPRKVNVYDNEAIGAIVIAQLLKELKYIEISKALLILPILLHDPTIKRLSSATKYRSIDEFLIKERINFGDVAKRLENLLPVTLNSLSILIDLKIISTDNLKIIYNTKESLTNLNNKSKRLQKIIEVIPKSKFLFEDDSSATFLKFNIQL